MAGLQASATIRVNPREVALSAPLIYLTQATQNTEGSVRLIAGRRALIRVFMIGDEPSYYGPGVRVTLFNDGQQVFQEDLVQSLEWTPDRIIESKLEASVNGVIPGSVLQPGVRMVVGTRP